MGQPGEVLLPDLFSGFNWLLGVRPAPRVAASETWRSWIYIESGYVWLLWIGGIPLLAFAWFIAVSLRVLGSAASRGDAVGAAATSGFCYLFVLAVLMLVDPHLAVRGSADLFFPLLALALVRERTAGPVPAARASGYDFVILDLPPALGLSDVQTVGSLADAVLLVVQWGATSAEAAVSAVEALAQVGIAVTGTALTQVNLRRHSLYDCKGAGRYYKAYRSYFKD